MAKKHISYFGQIPEFGFPEKWIASYYRYIQKKNDNTLSDRILNDLDLDQFIENSNHCISAIGQQFFYSKLRLTDIRTNNWNRDEKIIEKINSEGSLRTKIEKALHKLQNTKSLFIVDLIYQQHIEIPKMFLFYKLLFWGSVAALLFSFINSAFFLVFIGFLIVNSIIHYSNKKNLQLYIDAIPMLIRMHETITNLNDIEEIKEIDTEINPAIKELKSLRKKLSLLSIEAKMDEGFWSLIWTLMEMVKMAFLIEPIVFFNAIVQLKGNKKELEQIYRFIGKTDFLYAIASYRKTLVHYTLPVYTDQNIYAAEDLYHPLIKNCVSNTIHLENQSVLLTGSNMSGKTTFIRTIGINLISALAINTCFARRLTTTAYHLNSAIRMNDDLLNDKSYYFDEVLRIKEMLEISHTDQRSLFLLDEVFKGTNTVERIAAGKAVLEYLSKSNLVIVSTHDIELAELLKDSFILYHFSEQVDDNNIDFDYKLKPGKLTHRNAIKILKLNQYPEEVIEEAMKIAEKLDEEK
jgi:hypothetical protein